MAEVTLEQARELLERRNRAFAAADLPAFLALWSEDCVVEGPEHLLRGKRELGGAMERAWSVVQPLHMSVSSVAASGDTIFYEWVFVAEVRASGDRLVQTGMTAHRVGADGRFTVCREYFDPPSVKRPSALEVPAVRDVLS